MRSVSKWARGVVVVSLLMAVSAPAFARPDGPRDPNPNPVVRITLRIIRALGDGLTIPRP
ncbi:MAG TPA: hypothetical protein VF824_20110 [Thermoanaerobaculia bacterium]|jgi:hypothetical protein